MADYTTTQFTLTDQHIKLLQRAVIGWNRCEFGAPEINPKRPYGNSYVYGDIAEILDIDTDDDEGPTDEQRDQFDRIHKETELALQIILRTKTFTPGTYTREEYTDDWKLVGAA